MYRIGLCEYNYIYTDYLLILHPVFSAHYNGKNIGYLSPHYIKTKVL